jgi:hypothetical protein
MSQKMFSQFSVNRIFQIAVLSALLSTICTLHAEEPTLRVLVSNDGSTFIGTVEPNQFGYRLISNGRTELVNPGEVRCVAESLEDAYGLMSQEMEQFAAKNQLKTTADSHFQLARWCYQYGLYPQTQRELAKALTRDPKHTAAAELAKKFAPRDGEGGKSSDSAFIDSLKNTKSHDELRNKILIQSVEVEVTPLANLPKELASDFQKMQPVLATNCGKGGCHDQTTNREFVFLHLPRDGGMYRARLEQNMSELADAMNRAGSIDQFNTLVAGKNDVHPGVLFPGPFGKERLDVFTTWTKSYGKHAAIPLTSETTIAKKIPGVNHLTTPIQQVSFEQTQSAVALSKEAAKAREIEATLEKARQDHKTDAFDPSLFNNKRP